MIVEEAADHATPSMFAEMKNPLPLEGSSGSEPSPQEVADDQVVSMDPRAPAGFRMP
jgi:hypothetical protein